MDQQKKTEKCSICHTDVLGHESKSECPFCHHYFHFNHLREWLKIKGTCPICKEKMNENLFSKKPTTEAEKKEEFFFCSTCGGKNFQSASFCFQCGKPIIFPKQIPDKNFDLISGQIPNIRENRKIINFKQKSNGTIILSEVFLMLSDVYTPWKYDLQGNLLINWNGTILFEILGNTIFKEIKL